MKVFSDTVKNAQGCCLVWYEVCLKIEGPIVPVDIPVYIFIKQGAITSPMVCNNATLPAQVSIPIMCVVKATNASVLCYEDDLLSLSRSVSSPEEGFNVISSEFRKIGLNLNAGKSQVLLFNCPSELCSASVNLGGHSLPRLKSLFT